MMKKILVIVGLWSTLMASAHTNDSTMWRTVFTDPHLTKLIEVALKQNADLRTACLNVEQAEAQLRASRLAFLPGLTIGAEGTITETKGQPTSKTYNIPMTMQWEIDLAGRLRGEKRAAVASFWSTAETERAVRLRLIAGVAAQYYQLVMMDEQLNVIRQSVENARQTLEVTETLKEVGMQNEAAVNAAKAAYMNVMAQEKTLLQQIKTAENAMGVLVGQSIADSLLQRSANMDAVVFEPAQNYQLVKLANRPDVRAAEYALKAQMAQVDVARAAFYPQLNITATAGWTNNVGQVVNPGQMLLSAIGSLVQPLFSKGQNRANLRIAKARQEQALVAFNQSLLVAGAELSDALTACRLSSDRLALRQQEVAAAERAFEVSRLLMENSSATYLEVLVAQQTLLQARQALAADRLDNIQGKINLYKALGGEL